jgi:amino acid transporter
MVSHRVLCAAIIIIIAAASIATTSIIVNLYNSNPSLKEANPNNYNYIMMNLVLAVLFMLFGFYALYIDRYRTDIPDIKLRDMGMGGIGFVLFGTAVVSIANCSIGVKAFNDQPELKNTNRNSYNYIVMNLVLAVLLLLFSFYMFWRSYK